MVKLSECHGNSDDVKEQSEVLLYCKYLQSSQSVVTLHLAWLMIGLLYVGMRDVLGNESKRVWCNYLFFDNLHHLLHL